MANPVCSGCGMNMGKIRYVEDQDVTNQDGKTVGKVSEGEFGGLFVCVNSDCPKCHPSHKKHNPA